MRPDAPAAAKVVPISANGNGHRAGAVGLALRTASEIEPRRTVFLDAARMLPRASLVVEAGRAGLGKTLHSGALTAEATTGKLPGTDGPVDVVYSTGEDDPESVLVPRLIAAGADLDRVHFAEYRMSEDTARPLTLPDDVTALSDFAKQTKAALVVIDPIAAHLSSGVDSHKDADVRTALAPLASMASKLNLTCLVIAHVKKGHESDALSRVSGSGAFGNAPRSVLVFGIDPDDPDADRGSQRVIAHAKSNVAPRAESIACHIETKDIPLSDGPFEVPILVMDGASSHDASAVLDRPEPENKSEREQAKDWLLGHLELPIRSKELKASAEAEGITERTLERAKKDLGIKAEKAPDGWYWLPPGREGL